MSEPALGRYLSQDNWLVFMLDCSPEACGAVFPDADEGDELSREASHFTPDQRGAA